LQSVTDVKNVPLNVGKDNVRIEPKTGDAIALTIDRNVQSYAEEALKRGVEQAGATEGSVLVMNPKNGQVLADANYPTFAPAEYYQAKDAAVFADNTTMVPLEPGSIIKTFTMATALDKGAITPDSSYVNTDCIQVADRTMCNALRGLGGPTNVQGVLTNSLNVGAITFARRLGDGASINRQARDTIYDYFHNKFGFGEKTGIEVAEVPGLIYSPETTEGNEVRYSAMTFGQSMNLTMIQVATAFCSVVNGGEYYRPTLVAGTITADGAVKQEANKPERRTISEATSGQIRDLLVGARSATWIGAGDRPGYTIGGKTGTAETVTSTGEYTARETVATYIGFGGADEPDYVIMVRVAAPGKGLNLEGGLHASPIFSDISNWIIDFMKLAPKG
jgi:cell division protein FtsI/penicillin-binding protein 2